MAARLHLFGRLSKNMQLTQSAIRHAPDSEMDPLIEEAFHLYTLGSRASLNTVLTKIPEKERYVTFEKMVNFVHDRYGLIKGNSILRRIGQHENFKVFCEQLPHIWDQGIFFTNFNDLKTRVAVSFFDHPEVMLKEIDYTCHIYDPNGRQVFSLDGTLPARATHTFDIDQMGLVNVPFGHFSLKTSEEHIHSLRIYAYWKNDVSITTTHEKGALLNANDLIIYPTIICDELEETCLALSNTDPNDSIDMEGTLFNARGDTFSKNLMIHLEPRNSIFISLSQQLEGLREFLDGRAGMLYLTNNRRRGIYYYFIYNRKLHSWQIQHM